MRTSFVLFVGVGLAVVGSVAFLSWPKRADDGAGQAASFFPPDQAATDLFRRLGAKAAVTRRLLNGELTAPDAAAWFRYLDEASASGRAPVLTDDEGLSVDEWYGRQVIRWATEAARATGSPPSQVAVLVRRLEAEFLADGHYGAVGFSTTQSRPEHVTQAHRLLVGVPSPQRAARPGPSSNPPCPGRSAPWPALSPARSSRSACPAACRPARTAPTP